MDFAISSFVCFTMLLSMKIGRRLKTKKHTKSVHAVQDTVNILNLLAVWFQFGLSFLCAAARIFLQGPSPSLDESLGEGLNPIQPYA